MARVERLVRGLTRKVVPRPVHEVVEWLGARLDAIERVSRQLGDIEQLSGRLDTIQQLSRQIIAVDKVSRQLGDIENVSEQLDMIQQVSRQLHALERRWIAVERGFNGNFAWHKPVQGNPPNDEPNPLREFFDNHREGLGIWKWNHYFDVYDKHLRKFRGRQAHVLEIGIYSGGSLEMWRDYFGANARIYGVDIDSRCKLYENENINIFIGDQSNRQFWRNFLRDVPALDVVIDDGGHQAEQQIATIEELLPFIRPGGVYLCEDVHGTFNQFASYVHGLSHRLNDFASVREFADDDERRIVSYCTPFQTAVASVHLYPFLIVVERTNSEVTELMAPKHGSAWLPNENA